jgi:hypothetical protein
MVELLAFSTLRMVDWCSSHFSFIAKLALVGVYYLVFQCFTVVAQNSGLRNIHQPVALSRSTLTEVSVISKI